MEVLWDVGLQIEFKCQLIDGCQVCGPVMKTVRLALLSPVLVSANQIHQGTQNGIARCGGQSVGIYAGHHATSLGTWWWVPH